MRTKSKKTKKSFYSLTDIEKEFFPNSFKEKIREEKEEEPGFFGTNLAIDFLKKVEKELKNSSV